MSRPQTQRADLGERQPQSEHKDEKDSESVMVPYHLEGDSRKGKRPWKVSVLVVLKEMP